MFGGPKQSSAAALQLPDADTLRRLAVAESGFIFDPRTGRSYGANETGLAILRLLQKHTTLEAILADIEREYAVSHREAERQITEFVRIVRKHLS